jgi:hypothetical protein
MFDEYTTTQLVEIRSLCTDLIERTDEIKTRADSLLVMQHVEKELVMREQKQSV